MDPKTLDERDKEIRLENIYYEGWNAYRVEMRGGYFECPYNGVDEDEEFNAWWNGYYDAGWDD